MNKTMSMKQSFVLLGAIAAVLLLLVTGIAVFGLRHANAVQQAADSRAQEVMALRVEIGYGGAIHVFKNYVLRGGDGLAQRFEQHERRAHEAMDRYAKLDAVTQQNVALIEQTAAAADRLAQEAEELVQAIASFRLA